MRDRRYSMPAAKRKFGGKVYEYLFIANSKAQLAKDKAAWEAKGYSVRSVKYRGGYAVYIRRK